VVIQLHEIHFLFYDLGFGSFPARNFPSPYGLIEGFEKNLSPLFTVVSQLRGKFLPMGKGVGFCIDSAIPNFGKLLYAGVIHNGSFQ